MIGFQIENIDKVVETLENSGMKILSPLQDNAWGRRVVIQDPDGRAVELTKKRE